MPAQAARDASASGAPPMRRQVFEACLARTNVLRLEACILGADDLQASLGLKRQQGTGAGEASEQGTGGQCCTCCSGSLPGMMAKQASEPCCYCYQQRPLLAPCPCGLQMTHRCLLPAPAACRRNAVAYSLPLLPADDTLFARRWVVLHARAFGLQPIDQVYVRGPAVHWRCCKCRCCWA